MKMKIFWKRKRVLLKRVFVIAFILAVALAYNYVSSAVLMSVSPTTTQAGGTVTVTWSGIATPTPTDWIGLYLPGAGDREYIDWIWVSCSQTPGPSGREFGDCRYVVPAALAPGTYELRLYANNSIIRLATSNPLSITPPPPPPPELVGQWSSVMSWPIVAIHTHLLPTGKVMFWNRAGNLRLWDPATGTISTPALPGYNIFCSGHAFLANGRLLVTGGHITDAVGLPNASIYDPLGNSWTPLPAMNAGRWYPTSTILPNGDVLVISGTINELNLNTLPQIWLTASQTWWDLSNAEAQIPTFPSSPLGVELYPRMFVAPDGKVFKAGPDRDTWYLDTAGSGWWTAGPASNFGLRSYGATVMYDSGKVLIVGGGDPPTDTAEVIDLNAATPAWRNVSPMAFRRRQHNSTVLPDGTVLVTGGSSGAGFSNEATPIYAAEMWDPNMESWSTMASMQVQRLYHSTAILLPDGRVLSAGGGEAGDGPPVGWTNHPDAEIYSPPYLFRGARPAITSAPTTVTYGDTFFVGTLDAVSKVSLIRLASVTHTFNENQRFTRLDFTAVSGGLNVRAPSSANLAPPGHYMLFILKSNGVPSVAKIIQLLPSSSTNPIISVTPSSQDFGSVSVGSSADRAFTVQNTGGGTLGGSASTFAPFTIVSGGSYNLGAGGRQRVTVRFSPSSTGNSAGNVTFTGGGGASRMVTGVGVSGPQINASPTTVQSGASVTASWSGITAPTPNDWIGLYVPGAADTAYIDWMYVSCSKTASSVRPAGNCPFLMPVTLASGTYELRLFPNDRYTRLAISNSFTLTGLSVSPTTVQAGASVTATWSGITAPTPNDWIGLYVPGAPDSAYIDWMYVSCSKTAGSARPAGNCSFRMPVTLAPGTYGLRLYANESLRRLATSNSFTVTAAPP